MPANDDSFLLEPVPHDEAARWIADKPLVSREVFAALLPELQARAFLVTGIEDANVLGEVRSLLAEVPKGGDWEQAKKEIAAKVGPFLTKDADAGASALARAETLLRTHVFQSYAVAQHEVMRRQEDVFPYWQYLSSGDEKVRAAHVALNEIVAPANSDFWKTHTPPWQWGCRCRKVALLPHEVDELKAEDAKKLPEQQRVLEGTALKKLNEGTLDRGPGKQVDVRTDAEKGKGADGFHFEPDTLRIPVEQLKGRYDAQTWSEFEAAAKRGKIAETGVSVWEWLGGKAVQTVGNAPAVAPVPPATPPPAPAVASGPPTFKKPGEAAKWITKELGIPAGLNGMDVENAQSLAQVLHDQAQLYGPAITSLGFVGTRKGYIAKATEALKVAADQFVANHFSGWPPDMQAKARQKFIKSRIIKTMPKAIAWHTEKDLAIGAPLLVVEAKGYKAADIRAMAAAARKSNWTISGEDDRGLAQATFIHELGHQVDAWAGARHDPAMLSICASFKAPDLIQGLSRYGATNKYEIMAESWAEAHTVAQPRPIATEVATRMKELIDQKRKTLPPSP